MRSGIIACLLFALLSGCATTYGSLRAPPSQCTIACSYNTGDEERFRCMQQCPGAVYSEAACGETTPPGQVCANDTRYSDEGLAVALGVLEVVSIIAQPTPASSCHHHH